MGAPVMERERIKVREAALITGETERTLQAMALRGEIPGAAKPGKCWTFDVKKLRRWMQDREEEICRNARRRLTPIGEETFSTAGSRSKARKSDGAFERGLQALQAGKSRKSAPA